MEVDDAREARTPHAGSGAHPLAAAFGLGRSPLTPGGVGSDLFSPMSVLATINGHSGLRLVLPKGACGARRWVDVGTGGTDKLRRAAQTSRWTWTTTSAARQTRHSAWRARERRVRGRRPRAQCCLAAPAH